MMRRLWVVAVLSALPLAACANDGANGDGAGAGASVPFGASMEEYQEALADIDPIVLHTQTPSPKGAPSGARNEQYVAAVEEWSGGRITFDIQYSNAIADPSEADNALTDGRLDLTNVMPIYEPSEYPANGMINAISFVGSQKPVVGTLAASAWMLEVGYETPEIRDEYRKHGVELVLPSFNSGLNLIICQDPANKLADFEGKQIITGGITQSKQMSALGASPVSIPYTEVFESLQRSVAHCTGSTLLGADLGGYIPEANQVSYSPTTGFAITTGTFGMSQDVWESLPLAARQLMFDRLDVYLKAGMNGNFDAMAKAIEAIDEQGGGFAKFDSAAERALGAANDKMLDEARASDVLANGSGFVDLALESAERWESIAAELGYPDTADYGDFVSWWESDDADLQPFVDKMFEEILLAERPS